MRKLTEEIDINSRLFVFELTFIIRVLYFKILHLRTSKIQTYQIDFHKGLLKEFNLNKLLK